MVSLFCTKKLTELLPAKPAKCSGEIPALDRWYASVTTINRKKVVVAVCADNKFGIILWGVKKAQLSDLGSVVADGIRKTLAYYGVKRSVIEQYVTENEHMDLYAASDMKDIGKIAGAMKDLNHAFFYSYPDELLPVHAIRLMNNRPAGYSQNNKDSYIPYEKMIEKLKERYGGQIIEQPAFELEAELDLERYIARRTITVPVNYTFQQLHHILQIAFGWVDYHMHEFEVEQEGEPLRIMGSGADDDDDLAETPNILETDAYLSDILKENGEFIYLYDFGDGWEIHITVKKLMNNYDRSFAYCYDAEGAAPPEDVGGVYGYLDFLDAYNDPEHPEHEEVHEWVGYRWKPEVNINYINYMLK